MVELGKDSTMEQPIPERILPPINIPNDLAAPSHNEPAKNMRIPPRDDIPADSIDDCPPPIKQRIPKINNAKSRLHIGQFNGSLGLS
ncbi:hypothetical protein WICPIJ_003639 [Wickerhamomyces pijperi]|uniref:Uncharacterized protein n=1 Tax=Wickerhamomyces pijperi TaxID=599730 RepID=A0A9P8TP25_WICPI|nr:hypothetical protein WICPIJ_003639 [Wickerhamomyces pijperi]